jgi:hypothetical protein
MFCFKADLRHISGDNQFNKSEALIIGDIKNPKGTLV